jgi:Ca-activated chloride channel family protein
MNVWNAKCIHVGSRRLMVAALLSFLALVPWAESQSVDDAHITPRHNSEIASSGGTNAPLARLKVRPMRVDVNLVLVPVTVVDRMSHPITDLPRQNFALFEGEVPQPIQYFSHEDGPLSIALVLDFSGSMKNKIDYEREAVSQFFENANPEDDYYVVTVSDHPSLIASSTQTTNSIESDLATIEPKGATALFDAIYLATSKLRTARYQRRALLIISDGGDNHSRYTLKEIRHVVAEADVLTYSIGIFDDLPIPLIKTIEERMGRKWLDDITSMSGGRNIAAENRKAIPQIAALISRELRSQYVIGYRPSDPTRDGKWRKISVKLVPADMPGELRVHSKQGYVAPGP